MTIKHIVFDWDGTLVDTHAFIFEAFDAVFAQLGLAPIPHDKVALICRTVPHHQAFAHTWGNRGEEARRLYYGYFGVHHLDNLTMMPGAEEFLKYCCRNKIKCYICSNKKHDFLLAEIEKLGLSGCFAGIVGAGYAPKDKPCPEACRSVFADNMPEGHEILVVGDGEADVKMAECYKAPCVIYSLQRDYCGLPPQYLITDFAELPAIVEKR